MTKRRDDRPSLLRPGDRLRVKIEGLGSYGEGLARLEIKNEVAEIFVPKATPGDEVEVDVIEQKKGRYRARIVAFILKSSRRIEPRCSHFESCGGCDFQHIEYEDQMAWKLRMTKHWIRRSPLAPLLDEIQFTLIPSPNPYGYRHRVRLQIRNHQLHFFKPHSNELLEIHECPVLKEGFFGVLKQHALSLADTKDSTHTFNRGALVEGEDHYEIGGEKIYYNERCFTQANLEVNRALWKFVQTHQTSLNQHNAALDLFCGVGNFTLPLKNYFKHVVGVESDNAAIEIAKKTEKSIEWHHLESDRALINFEKERRYFDLVLLDPPRVGARTCVELLAKSLPERIIYISCSLDSLIPDLVHLFKRAKYRISHWAVADMFPQTHHIESAVVLERKL